ncbi:YihY/virulence factor BrkB family protein [Chthonobacter albigriseus]|uniref:YihY/virulence factor BrkB family protein n=1 Tax=Chthonobacter albigriseus TaxID=1683161 RepID=UPI0015EEE9A9|nr:YihY/virulence factor BrkB family protein [Chthonobacter albigriseus]
MSFAADPMNDGRNLGRAAAQRPRWVELAAAAATFALVYRFTDGRRTENQARRASPAGVLDEPRPEVAIADAGRGRAAERPSEIPAKGWKDVLWRTWQEIGSDRVLAVGAGVTFYALLAIFPFIGAFVSLYGLVADPSTVQEHLAAMAGVLPASALDILGDQMQRLASNDEQALGFGFIVSLVLALWSANAGMKAVFDALNVAYDEDEKRSFIALNALSLAFTLGSIVFLILAITALVVLPIALDFVGLGATTELLFKIGRWPALFLLVAAAIAMLYRYGPSRSRAKWRWITWGAALAAVLFIAVSIGFSFYAANFADYNATYGSLGAVIAFMTWIWLSCVVILVGAELNAEVEHQTARDSTVGPEKPRGARGATMADTIGEPQVR